MNRRPPEERGDEQVPEFIRAAFDRHMKRLYDDQVKPSRRWLLPNIRCRARSGPNPPAA